MNAGKRAVIGGMFWVATVAGAPARADGPPADDRPPASALRLGESDVLAGFTSEVRTQPKLRERALTLWRTHFAAPAAVLQQRFTHEDDWRPALADAAALIDDFLEASLLPRAQQWRAGHGQIWVEKLDPTTGQRTRTLQQAPARPLLLAPEHPKSKSSEPGADGLKVDPAVKCKTAR
jgi:hypothetical protein